MGGSFGGTAYVSYSREDEKNYQVVTQLQEAFKDEWVDLKVDKREIGIRESFDDFIKEIGEADCVIIIFSESYFQSFYCMLELANVMKKGNAVTRIFPVFADQDYRFDGSKQRCISYWETVRDDWFGDKPPSDPTRVFGSQDECDLILDQLCTSYPDNICEASFFDDFSRRVAATIPNCNDELIDWVKQTYFEKVSNSSNFDDARVFLGRCSNYIKSAVKVKIDEADQGVPDSENDQIAYLSKVSIPELLDLFFKIHKQINKEHLTNELRTLCLDELSTLLRKLLPSLFSPPYLAKLRDICDSEQEIGIIEIPHATTISAELLMAGVDEREADFIVKDFSTRRQLYPGRYNLRLPPESGTASPTDDIDDDLANQLGLKSVEVSNVLANCDQYLANGFADRPSATDDHTLAERRELTQLALSARKKFEEPRLYWILSMTRDVNQELWNKITKHIQVYYPEIILISLGGDFEQKKSELSLFATLERIIPANKLMSNNP